MALFLDFGGRNSVQQPQLGALLPRKVSLPPWGLPAFPPGGAVGALARPRASKILRAPCEVAISIPLVFR